MSNLDVDSLFTNIPLMKQLIFASFAYLKTLILLKVLQSQNLNIYSWLQSSPILYLTVHFARKLMVYQ